MTDLPPPLTPARSDLRDFGWMPLEVVRFRGSDMLTEDGDVVVAALMLWTAAWHETPAASLTDDDKALAKAAGFGRAVSAWLDVKERALRGFVKCSDGRLYHPVVARLAREAWKGKVEQRWRTEVGRLKKHNERHPDEQRALPSFEAFAAHYPDNCPDDNAQLSQRQLALVPATEADCLDETASKGKGESRERERETLKEQQPPTPTEPEPDVWAQDLPNIAHHLAELGGVSLLKPSIMATALDMVRLWKADGLDMEATVADTIRKYRIDNPDAAVSSLAFFDGAIRRAHARTKNGAKPNAPSKPIPPIDGQDDADARIPAIRDAMRKKLGERVYEQWFGKLRTVLTAKGETLAIRSTSPFASSWLQQHYGDDLFRIASRNGFQEVQTTP